MPFSIGKSSGFFFNDQSNDQSQSDEQEKRRKSGLNIIQLDNSFDTMITRKKHRHKRQAKHFFFIASLYAR